MKSRSKFREWINRDDGRYYQVGNQVVGAFTVIGTLIGITSLVLFQLQSKNLIQEGWALGSLVIGFTLFTFGFARDSRSGT